MMLPFLSLAACLVACVEHEQSGQLLKNLASSKGIPCLKNVCCFLFLFVCLEIWYYFLLSCLLILSLKNQGKMPALLLHKHQVS